MENMYHMQHKIRKKFFKLKKIYIYMKAYKIKHVIKRTIELHIYILITQN